MVPFFKKHLILTISAVLLFVLGSTLITWRLMSLRGQNVIAMKEGPVVEAVYGLGIVIAKRSYLLKMGIATTLKTILVQEGDRVQQGQVMATFDEGQVSKAPFPGIVTLVAYKLGETVFPQVPVLAVTDLTQRYISVSLEQQGALRVQAGQNARLSFESLRAESFRGIVRSIFPADGQFIVRIEVDNLPPEVLPGMTADVAIEVSRREKALLVPVSAITAGQVVRVRDGHRSKIGTKIGILDGEWAEVVSGDLTPQDHVLVRSH
jgi:multidrug efflux pump subunit AcrA (membrane-fusion protein)